MERSRWVTSESSLMSSTGIDIRVRLESGTKGSALFRYNQIIAIPKQLFCLVFIS
jgi:hypothetical protein